MELTVTHFSELNYDGQFFTYNCIGHKSLCSAVKASFLCRVARTTSAHKTPVAAGASRMKENSFQFMINPIYFYNPSHPLTLFFPPQDILTALSFFIGL